MLGERSILAEDIQIPLRLTYSFEEEITRGTKRRRRLVFSGTHQSLSRIDGAVEQIDDEVRQAWEEKKDALEAQLKKLSGNYAELLNQRVLGDPTIKRQISAEMGKLEQDRRAIEEQLERLQREFHYYS